MTVATISLIFHPRNFYGQPDNMYECASDLEILNARVLGRADDLGGGFDAAAQQFTDIIAWDIRGHSEEDVQKWRDAAVTVSYAASVAEMWADAVKAFKDERDAQISTWETSKSEKESAVPSAYQGDRITESHPQADGFLWTDWGAGDEKKCRDLYNELSTVQEGLITREQTNWDKLEEIAEDARRMLEEGPTPDNVSKLIEAGNASWGFLSLDPSRYSSLIGDDIELTPENAEEYANDLAAYWSGDRPIDDRYHELMLVMSMLGTSAKQHQENGTEFSSDEVGFLEEFYKQLEEPYLRDGVGAGVMLYPELMAESGMSDEERERALGVLGDGLLALSDPRIGGGYDSLPQSFRYAVEGPWINPDADGKMPATPVSMGMDMKALSAFMEHTDDNLEAGYGLSTNLHLATGAFLDAWGHEVHDSDGVLPDSEQVSHMVDVASRNKDSNYYILTGEHLNEEPGVPHGDADLRTQALEGTLTFEWHDDGHTARQLTDWLAEDVHSEDPELSQRAGDAFTGFMETITDSEMHDALTNTGVSVTEGDNEYSDASFTQFNGALADSLADIFDAHIYSFANGDILDTNGNAVKGIGDFDPDTGYVRMGPDERAQYMQLLMGNDETAGRVVNSVDVYQQIEAVAYLESGDGATSARGSAQLQGLLERALYLESADRSADLDATIARETQIADFVVSEAGNLSEKIPVIGQGVSKGMELGKDSIVGAIVDGDYDVSPRFPTYTSELYVERNFQVETLDFVLENDPGVLNEDTRRADLRTLVDGGALSIEQDGRKLEPGDITDDFVFDESVTLDFEKDPSAWTHNEGRELSGMDDALGKIMDATVLTANTTDPHTGEPVEHTAPGREWVEDFTGEYNSAYRTTRDYFGGELEQFGEPPEEE
ncbi:TPR repeat region-containing protein [Nocardiopsis prasina]|uniref:TPR repeat region-containing protein n=1 Tax=Nocardiopsis prasina TaxID=2015 RepID=UPI00035D0ECA